LARGFSSRGMVVVEVGEMSMVGLPGKGRLVIPSL
jgi:hypothetical protein